jgi:general secretion pathway protein A
VEDIAPKKDPTLTAGQKEALLAHKGDIEPTEENETVEETAQTKREVKNSAQPMTAAPVIAKELPVIKDFTPAFPARKTIIQFDHNSNDLPEHAFEKLNDIVRYAIQNPQLEILIEGYTDSHGNYWYNKKLSKFRADIIKSYFTGQGVPASRLKSLGLGPENPLASNETFEGRKQNRRVEITIGVKK